MHILLFFFFFFFDKFIFYFMFLTLPLTHRGLQQRAVKNERFGVNVLILLCMDLDWGACKHVGGEGRSHWFVTDWKKMRLVVAIVDEHWLWGLARVSCFSAQVLASVSSMLFLEFDQCLSCPNFNGSHFGLRLVNQWLIFVWCYRMRTWQAPYHGRRTGFDMLIAVASPLRPT